MMPLLSGFGRFLVDALTWRVRVIAHPQIAEIALAIFGIDDVGRELSALMKSEILATFSMPISLLELDEPIFCSVPDSTIEPNYGQVCWQAKSRFLNRQAQNHKVFFATRRAERQFGGVGGQIRQPFQLLHDLGTASVFVAYTLSPDPSLGARWMSEDVLRRYFRFLKLKKIPDAAMIEGERLISVVEFVGRDYTTLYLRRFHQHWTKKQIPYQIW